MGGSFSGWGAWILGGLAVIAVAIAGFFLLRPPAPPEVPPQSVVPAPDPEPSPEPAPQPDAAPEPSPEPEPAPETEPAPEPAPETEPDAAPEPATETEPAPEAQPAPETEPEPDAAPEPASQPEAEAPPPLAPDFDIVRIRPDGGALVAGRAEPGARISVLVEGEEMVETLADRGANFVAMFSLPPSGNDRVMRLEATLDDGERLVSTRSVIIEGVAMPEVVAEAAPAPQPAPAPTPERAPETAPEPEAAPAPVPEAAPQPSAGPDPAPAPEGPVASSPEPEPAPTPTTEPEPAPAPSPAPEPAPTPATEPAPAPQTPAAPQAPAAPQVAEVAPGGATGVETAADAQPGEAPPALPPGPVVATEAPPAPQPAPEPAAPRVLLAGPEGITVLQDPGPAPPLSIDTISYDATGEVALAGRGAGEETVRIYLDNAPVRSARVGPDGQWRVPLPGVDTGVYTLRVDSIAPDGAVTSRVETPFKREEPEVLEAAGKQAAEAVASGRKLAAVTIQPGHTLWAIAEDRYGEGIQYVRIFRANRDLIRDPDWIYPGQVFTLPDAD
ncbi:LysM peptidoglycan-binding domain-containing protein [Sinisalibacter lacisalsi]|uniref:LysM domain-containing protein n=1 Tax=Sinisalibacter lacisalsi TaxID=1526570 RepID=A0ABQ1QLJ7_9RHOB|nr:LysM peptidoglycan-binding domain-containing protein [Sinisalibacter lacisalsi]GGD29458.1 hypothetical protein GCM10011358_11850 [Sinisalibacter lacisalsi]